MRGGMSLATVNSLYGYTNSTNPEAVAKPPLIKPHNKFVQTSDSFVCHDFKDNTHETARDAILNTCLAP